jgi:hypothetical protein
MVAHIDVEKENMDGSDPNAIDDTDQKTVQKVPFTAIFCNEISADYKNNQPKY